MLIAMPPDSLLEYSYQPAGNVGTTGFFACLPIPEPDFASGLRILSQRPLDTFLHRHLLANLTGLSTEALCALARECLARDADTQKPLAALLLECARAGARIPQDILLALKQAVPSPYASTPLPILARNPNPGQKSLCQAFAANIHSHQPLPELAADICPTGACGHAGQKLADLYPNFAHAAPRELPEARATAQAAGEALTGVGILEGPEMRHEASLSPIALLRQWRVRQQTSCGRNRHCLSGIATAYGRGLSLAQARASCLMEIVERACAYAGTEQKRERVGITHRKNPMPLHKGRFSRLDQPAVDPEMLGAPPQARDEELYWLEADTAARQRLLVPASAVFLFANLDEPDFFEDLGSTGLASGNSTEQARLAALVEVLERYAQATTPYSPRRCFRLCSRDSRIQGLLDDYSARHIWPQFQDISTEFGLPAYRCFVTAPDGSVAQATGSGLSGAAAALSALTETPWPYSWATPAPFGRPSRPPDPNLPGIYLEDLPDYSLPDPAAALKMLEQVLISHGCTPVYADISRADLPFAVARCLVPGLETNADHSDSKPLPPILLQRAFNQQNNF